MMKIETGMGGMPASGCEFVAEDAERELVMPAECPEFSDRAIPLAGREGVGRPETAIKGGIKRKKRNKTGQRRGPKPRFTEELFERVRRRVARGERVGTAVRGEGMGTSRFYECMADRPIWAIALRHARENKRSVHASRRAADRQRCGGETKAAFMQDLYEGDLRQLSNRMLILLLKAAAPEKYGAPARRGKGECGMVKIEMGGMEKTPESGCDFVAQTADGESVMREDCPELCKAPPCTHIADGGKDTESKAPPCTHGASGAEDTETGRHEAFGNELGTKSGVAAPRSPAPSGTPPSTHTGGTPPRAQYSLSAVRSYAARRWEGGDQPNRRNWGVNSFRKVLGEKC